MALSACGGGGGSDSGSNSTPPSGGTSPSDPVVPGPVVLGPVVNDGSNNAPPGGGTAPSLALLAGDMGGSGNADGVGAVAKFSHPSGIATDSAGNIYVADTGNRTIRKITPEGVVTTFAGTAGEIGTADGTGPAASFNSPTGVATDATGNVYVADEGNHTIRKITPAGVVTTFAGTARIQGSTDATGADARFSWPNGVATDSAGNVYVADTLNFIVRKITPAGVVTTLAGTAGVAGSTDATGAAARFRGLHGVATDSAGNVYVADRGNHTIRKITPAGVVTTFAGLALVPGSTDGTGAARFTSPQGIATDSADTVYVTDQNNDTLRKITPAGVVITLAGTADVPGSTDATESFNTPAGVATGSAGIVYLADRGNSTIRKITPAGVVTTFAGSVRLTGSTDATGAAARFRGPADIATDGAGNVYMSDTGNHTLRKITPAGVVTTLAGTAEVPGNTDATGGAASFRSPKGIATDSAGNLYVSDSGNRTIRKITPAGVVTSFAGSANAQGNTDATGTAASFNAPSGIATDSADNVYVADRNTIRKITPAGVVTTLAGTPGVAGVGSADGTGAAASFDFPAGIATDGAGNVFVADQFNSTIRKITPAGVVTTLAGTAGIRGSTDATGAAASFWSPAGIATDSVGNVYVADLGSHAIRKITPAGTVSTVVGVARRTGFVPGPLPGVLSFPSAVVVSGTSLHIALYNGVAVVQNLP